MSGRHEVRQHRNPKSGDRGVELRDQIGTAELRGDPWRDLRQVVQLRREQQFLDIADEAVMDEVTACGDRRGPIEIARRRIEPEAVIQQLAPDDPSFLRHRETNGDICLALRQAEQPRRGHELQVEVGIPLAERH
jgi:hypothetical protein